MIDRISLRGIAVEGRHGVFDFEKDDTQLFKVDLDVFVSTREAASTDQLADTVDYGVLAEGVAKVVGGPRHDLIETVAHRIADSVMEDDRVERVIVTLHKPEAPIAIPFDDVFVTVDRGR